MFDNSVIHNHGNIVVNAKNDGDIIIPRMKEYTSCADKAKMDNRDLECTLVRYYISEMIKANRQFWRGDYLAWRYETYPHRKHREPSFALYAQEFVDAGLCYKVEYSNNYCPFLEK